MNYFGVIELKGQYMLYCKLKSALILLVLLQLVCLGCDYCETPVNGSGTNPQEKIYFSVAISNNEIGSIYRCEVDGSRITQLVSNALFYSAPSKDGTIAFLRISENNINSLWTVSHDGKNEELLEVATQQYGISNPIISPNGDLIAFYGGNNRLFIYDLINSVVNFFPNSIVESSIPSFSPNGEYLAYLENINGVLNLVVKFTSDFNIEVLRKEFINKSMKTNIFQRISWTQNSEVISFSLENEQNDFIILQDIKSGATREIEINDNELGAFDPEISSEGDYVIFTANNGALWVVDLKDDNYKFYELTTAITQSENLAAILSNDDSSILFLSRATNSIDNRALIKANFISNDDLFEINDLNVITNNVKNAYWGMQ